MSVFLPFDTNKFQEVSTGVKALQANIGDTVFAAVKLAAVGDYVEFKIPPNCQTYTEVAAIDEVNGNNLHFILGGYCRTYHADNSNVDDNYVGPYTIGDSIRLTKVSGNKIKVSKNGTDLVTPTLTFPNSTKVGFLWGYNAVNDILLAPQTNYTLHADFALSNSPFNYGSTITATDASTGGFGTKNRIWKLNGVSNGQIGATATFSGLGSGSSHTISLVITDDLVTDTLSRTIYVGQITPPNPTLAVNSNLELTGTIPNAVWSISGAAGTFSDGSAANKKILTATAAGTATVTASESIWNVSSKQASITILPDDSLITNTVATYNYIYSNAYLKPGDYAEFIFSGNHAAYQTYEGYGVLSSGKISFANQDIGLATTFVAGDIGRLRLNTFLEVEVYRNGAKVHTFANKLTNGGTLSTNIVFDSYLAGSTSKPYTFSPGTTNAPKQESVTATVYQPALANFTLSPAPYNLGATVTATDTSSGPITSRVWKVDGAVSSQPNPSIAAFSGLALGLHTISLTVTDIYGSNTKTANIYIGQITPAGTSLLVGGQQEFTGTIANAIWSLSNAVGTLATGSTAYKKVLNATVASSATLTAKSSFWDTLATGWSRNLPADSITFSGSPAYTNQYSVVALTKAGDYFETIINPNNDSRVGVIDTERTAVIETYGGGIIWSGSEGTGSNSTLANYGDVYRFVRRADNKCDVFKNGALFVTSYTLSSSAWNFLVGFGGGTDPATNTVVVPVFSVSGTTVIQSESTTVNVYAALSISTNSSLPVAVTGNNYAQQLAAAGGSGAGSWSLLTNDLNHPVNLGSGGVVSFNYNFLGTISFTVRYSDSNTALGYVDKQFQVTVAPPPPTPPLITSKSPLPYAQIGDSYAVQLKKVGGAGSGTWIKTVGNLPDGALAANGLVTIPSAGASNYTFTARYTDDAGFDEKSFTIPVSEYAAITFIYKRPLQIDYIQKQRYFEPLDGDGEVIEDAPLKREFTLNVLFTNTAEGNTLRQFLSAHRNREKFLWVNPDRNNEALLVKMVSKYSEQQLYTDGYFQIVIREV